MNNFDRIALGYYVHDSLDIKLFSRTMNATTLRKIHENDRRTYEYIVISIGDTDHPGVVGYIGIMTCRPKGVEYTPFGESVIDPDGGKSDYEERVSAVKAKLCF